MPKSMYGDQNVTHKDYDIELHVQKLHPDAVLPFKKNKWDAGHDLVSIENIELYLNRPTKIRTGLAIAIPKGYMGLIWDRSGKGSEGVKVMGGCIDSGYTGEIIVCLNYIGMSLPRDYETGLQNFYKIQKGDKIAQILFAKSPQVSIISVEDLSVLGETERGNLGFGSSGR